MASEAGFFTNLEQVRGEPVLVGDNERLEVQVKGEVRMKSSKERSANPASWETDARISSNLKLYLS
jgi:hypothetical protein